MESELLQRFRPEEYYKSYLADGVRPDGRMMRERRKAQLQRSMFGSAYGSASVRLGDSSAVAGVRARVTEAVPEMPARGSIVGSVELHPLSSSAFREKNRASATSNFLTSAITEILNSSQVFDPDQLDIRKGEVFWVLHVHVVCMNFDGNLFDLCLLAAVAALEDTLLPSLGEGVGKVEELGRLVALPPGSPNSVSEARQVALLSRPLPVTFAQLPEEHWVLDPSAAEEALGASVSLCLVGSRWLVHHQGGTNLDRFLGELMPLARSCVSELMNLLDEGDHPGDMSVEAS